MTVFEGSAKDYAASLGLAKPGKGRMSREATEAVAKARAEGMTFSKEAVKSVTVRNRPESGKPIDLSDRKPVGDFDAKAVRAWAKSNGIEVSERGRISAEVKAAYADDNPDVERTVKVIAGKNLRPSAPMTSEPGTHWTGYFHDKTVKVNGATCCTNCKVSLAYHTCNAPRAVVGDGTIIPLAIDR